MATKKYAVMRLISETNRGSQPSDLTKFLDDGYSIDRVDTSNGTPAMIVYVLSKEGESETKPTDNEIPPNNVPKNISTVDLSMGDMTNTVQYNLSKCADELFELGKTGILPNGVIKKASTRLSQQLSIDYTRALAIVQTQVNTECINVAKSLNDDAIDSICISYTHDFGLLSHDEQAILRTQCKTWFDAILKR